MAQAGRIVICGDAGDALGDSLYEAVIYVRGKVRSLGADARFEPMTDADYAAVRELLEQRRPRRTTRKPSSAWRRRRACITGTPMPTRNIESMERTSSQLEESAGYDRRVIDYIQRASATGLYEIRGLGAKRHLPSFDDLVFLGASLSRYPLEGYREKCSTRTVLGTRHATKPIELATPITIAGMSFGALSARVKEALGRAATALGTSTTTGDGGMTPRGARVFEDPRLPMPAVALWIQSRRCAARRCHRDRHRAGRQARRRRHVVRPEGQSARGGDAHVARGRRSALGLAPPGLDRARMTS